jgi:signal transduction histidine kinase/FixJ family two-component response regulator
MSATKPIHLLLIEDDPDDVLILKEDLAEVSTPPFHITCAGRLDTGLACLAEGGMEVVLLDLNLPDSRGLDTLTTLLRHTPSVPVVVLSGLADEALALMAVQQGAQDYLVKGRAGGQALARIVHYAIERHRLYHNWQISETRTRTIIEQNLDSLLIADGAGVVRFVNPAAEALWGRPASQLIGAAFGFPVEGDTPSELEIGQPDGSARVVEMRAAMFAWDGQPASLISLRDITDRKQAEQAMQDYSLRLEADVAQRTQALRDAQAQLVRQEKLAVLGQLASSIAHELRNPLGVIANAVYYLKAVQAGTGDTILDYLGLISAEVKAAETIITSLLDFVQPKVASFETVDLAALVEGVLREHPPTATIRVVREGLSQLPPVWADPRHIQQVLANLVVNACQAMPEGGTLTLRAEVAQRPLSVSPEGRFVALRVMDTGTGISPEDMEKLFEPFFSTKAKGVGLGLAIAKKLIEINGGIIEGQSEPGQGSTLTIFLPLDEHGKPALAHPPGLQE